MRTTAGLSLLLATIVLVPAAHSQRPGLRIRLEPAYVNPYGHDQHVLTIHRVTLAPASDRKTAMTLDTKAGFSYVGGAQYTRGRWTWGVDFAWFDTKQELPEQNLAAGAGTDSVRFEVADLSFTSSSPAEVLFYRVLDDTEMALWTLDFYGIRTLAELSGGYLGLQLGLRFADFDNDYRAMVGVVNSNGLRIDASSNYGRMMGPLVGVVGTTAVGRVALDGYLGQSVVIGKPAMEMLARRFTGPADAPVFVSEELFESTRDIAIPITELRIKGTIGLVSQVSLGAGVTASSWWDVAVPPGIVPLQGGDQVLHENTLVFLGLMGILEIRF